ncbi:hypothetical protein L2E82_25704 [Cichorium intybus]|uniref:Uncharacterized protein n=1 Tax=Cichorium intybus TaxID=13427 RepID=A0ACB9E488_CICIN|nr:hypothetical protein L2E82_25704 [Cichorium intybus]
MLRASTASSLPRFSVLPTPSTFTVASNRKNRKGEATEIIFCVGELPLLPQRRCVLRLHLRLGFGLAVSATAFIGSSFIIKKKDVEYGFWRIRQFCSLHLCSSSACDSTGSIEYCREVMSVKAIRYKEGIGDLNEACSVVLRSISQFRNSTPSVRD